MLGRDLEVAAHMVLHQLFHIFRALHGQVIAQARPNENFLNPFDGTAPAVHLDQRAVVGSQVLADARIHTAGFAAGGLNLGRFAAQAIHIGGGAAQIGNGAGKAFDLVANIFDFFDDRVFRSALNDAAFMLGNRTKRAAAKTAAHDVDTEADHFPGRDFGGAIVATVFVRVAGMRTARIGQVKHHVHFRSCQGDGRRRDPHVARGGALPMGLHQGAGIARIGFQMQHAVGMGIKHRIAAHLFVAGQADDRAIARRHLQLAFQRRVSHKNHGLPLHAELGWRLCSGRSSFNRAFLLSRLRHLRSLVITGATGAVFDSKLRGGHIRVVVRLHPSR